MSGRGRERGGRRERREIAETEEGGEGGREKGRDRVNK